MGGLLLTRPFVCSPVKRAQILAWQEVRAGAQQPETQGELFLGNVSVGSRQLWSCVDAPVLLPPLPFILSFCSLTLSFLF